MSKFRLLILTDSGVISKNGLFKKILFTMSDINHDT